MAREIRTVLDDGGARASAVEAWLTSTMHHFRSALAQADADPSRSVEEARKVLEGWAHLVCVRLEPTFRPYEGRELRREPLAVVLKSAREHVPPGRRELLTLVKHLGDSAHHNQGQVQQISARTARATVMHCADLLEWLYAEVLGQPAPSEVTQSHVTPVATPLPAPTALSPRSSRAWWVVAAAVLVGAALALLLASKLTSEHATRGSGDGAGTSSPSAVERKAALAVDPLALVKRYENRIAARDIDGLLSLQRFPTPRWFLATEVAREVVRDNYVAWFRLNNRRVLFEECVEVVGGGALCQVRMDPPSEKHPARVPTCLVFDKEGFLISRTELQTVPACPPAGAQ